MTDERERSFPQIVRVDLRPSLSVPSMRLKENLLLLSVPTERSVYFGINGRLRGLLSVSG